MSGSESLSVLSDSLRPHGLQSPLNSPGQNSGVGSHSLLQGIFPTQGSNPGLPHYRQILYQLSHQGSPRILGWVAYPFSRRSSQPRNWTGVSCIASGFFTSWTTRQVLECLKCLLWISQKKKKKVNYNKVVREKSKFRKEWWTRRLERDSKMGKCFTILTPQKVHDNDFKVSVALSS